MRPTSVLFGEPGLNARKNVRDDRSESRLFNDETVVSAAAPPPPRGSLSHFFFGFMYDDETESVLDEDDLKYSSTIAPSTNIWNPLNASLFLSLALQSFATSVPVALVASVAGSLADDESAAFAPRATAAAVLGTSIGKFVNGPVGDIVGARRASFLYSILLSFALLLLAVSSSVEMATSACFLIEFANSVQWPCCLVTLATHYRGDSTGMFEGGIYVTSLAGRLGSLIGIPLCSLLLRRTHWRVVAGIGAWIALVASSVTYLFVTDSPDKKDEPQNPIDQSLLQKWFPDYYRRRKPLTLGIALRMAQFTVQTNLLPSIKHILLSGTFWLLALSHTGSSMVRTSERVLGSYLLDTSNETMSEERAAGLSVFFSIGSVSGLIIAGRIFAARPERERKWLISRLYVATILACYTLSLLAIPRLRRAVAAPSLITIFQVMAIVVAGFGISVQFYHIPGLVGASFGCDKGMFSAYNDGIAYGISSFVWRIVGDVVQTGQEDGGGWAYGWAAVALMLIPSSILMVEFFEHYFCRHRYNGTYETIIFA